MSPCGRSFLLACITTIAFAAPAAAGETNLLPAPTAGWKLWSPRPNLAPEAEVVPLGAGSALKLRSTGAASYGEWRETAQNIRPSQQYRFEVRYRPDHVDHEDVSVAVVLSWLSAGGNAVQRDYVSWSSSEADGWRVAARTLPAPANTSAVRVELILRWSAAGSVTWKDASLMAADPASLRPPRHARIVTTRISPVAPSTVQKNLALIEATFDQAGAMHPDLVLFTETLVDRGTGLPVTETAEPIPGPATEMLSAKARQYRTWTAMSLHEADKGLIYNTAVLIDRDGRIVGKYRKVHLPLGEAENGITPGADYPVFDTDFGRVGMLTCWDLFFPEAARILRLKGADIILMPSDGDGVPGHWDFATRALAAANSVYFVASSTAKVSPSIIIDPNGKVLASTTDGVVSADIDVDMATRVYALGVGPALGEAKNMYIKERHQETYGPLIDDMPRAEP